MKTIASRWVWLGAWFAAACTAACAPPLANPPRSKIAAKAPGAAESSVAVATASKPVAALDASLRPPSSPIGSLAQAAPVPAKPKGIEAFVQPKAQGVPQASAPAPDVGALTPQAPVEARSVAADDELERFVAKRASAATADAASVQVTQAAKKLEELEEPEEPRDGKYLYVRNCSGCHGLTGKGDGETAKQLGVLARDFAAGGFAFGNTREAMFRTISSGLPGRSVMPAFSGTLTEDERWLVVDYVRTLMPPAEDESSDGAEIVVQGDCAMARGKLPSIVEHGPEVVRGLLLGFPGGLTMEYAIDDVRPIAARLGAFAVREDWSGRGGSYLLPLGTLIHHYAAGGTSAAFEVSMDGQQFKAAARLKDSWARGDEAGLAYELLSTQRSTIGQVREDLAAIALGTGTAIERRLTLEAFPKSAIVTVLAAKLPAGEHRTGTRELPRLAGSGESSGPGANEQTAKLTAWWAQVAPDQFALLVMEGAISCGLDPSGVVQVRVACSHAATTRLRLVFAPAAAADEASLERVLAEFVR